MLGVTFAVCLSSAFTQSEQLKVDYFSSPLAVKVKRAATSADSALYSRFSFEKNIYRGLAAPLLRRAKQIDSQLKLQGRSGGFIAPHTQLLVIEGLVTLSYLLAVGARIFVLLPVISFLAGWLLPEISSRSNTSFDFLSQLNKGGGRLFYSGIDLAFTPKTQVPNLLSLSTVGKATVKKSPLYRTLVELEVDTPLTEELSGYLAFYRDTPFSVEKTVSVTDWATSTLKTLLTAQQHYRSGSTSSATATTAAPLQVDLDRALTSNLQSVLANKVTPEILAVAVLLVATSKILTFKRFNQDWVQVSAHPSLQARAILNSMESFTDERLIDEKTSLRQAVYYSKRSIMSSKNNFPKNMSPSALALRQVAELLFIADEKKRSSEASVSRFLNLRDELLAVWQARFIKAISSAGSGCVLTTEDTFFAPLQLVIDTFESVSRSSAIKDAYLQAQTTVTNSGSIIPPHWKSIPLIQSRESSQRSAKKHTLQPADAACWAIMEPVLRSACWIETFVAGESVPADGLCIRSFNGNLRKALVPINVDKLTDTVGSSCWRSQFPEMKVDSKARAKSSIFTEPKGVFMRRVK